MRKVRKNGWAFLALSITCAVAATFSGYMPENEVDFRFIVSGVVYGQALMLGAAGAMLLRKAKETE